MSSGSAEHFKRVNVMLRPDQKKRANDAGLNLSGLIRGLIDDHFSEEKIVLSVSPRVKEVYHHLISNLGAEDRELEIYFLEALDKYLADKTRRIDELRKSIKRE